MKQEKTFSHFWLYRLLPEKIVSYLELIRFEKPTGFLLLVWPCWFCLAMLSITDIKLYIFFFIGSFCMRSVGCIVNDYFDRFIDKKVKRTSDRPLAKGKLSLLEAFTAMSILLIFSLMILLQFNKIAIIIAAASIPLIIIYPLMKRFTYWPQLILGLTFSWGILIASAQSIETISIEVVLLYIACVFWTLGYDTIYAYQDREDDIKIKLKSTAVLFDYKGKLFVMFFYTLFVFFILIIQNLDYFQLIYSLILVVILIGLMIFLSRWSINSRSSSNKYFRSNNIIGLIFFLYFVFFI